MINTKCDKCKKTCCWSCDMCQSKPFQCFVCVFVLYVSLFVYPDVSLF